MGFSETVSDSAFTRVPPSSSSEIGKQEQYALALSTAEMTGTAGITDWLPDFLRGRATEGKCAPSPLYDHALDIASRFYHDQSAVEKLRDFKAKFNCEIKTDDDAVNYANEALQVFGDPYTKVLNKKQADELRSAIQGETEVSGIGINIGMQKNERTGGVSYPIVSGVFPGTPAERAGLKPGDIIMQVGDQSTKDMALQQVQLLVTGEPGSRTQLKIDRDGKWLDVFVVRQKMEVPAIVHQRFGDVQYARLINFMNDKTDTSLKDVISQNPDAKAFIVDLRGNPGGRVEEMIETVGLLMKKGKLYTEETRTPLGLVSQTVELSENRVKAVRPGALFNATGERNQYMLNGRPLVVLVDEYSASASELLAGAVRGNDAGLLVGSRTFGKGVGQALVPIDNGTMVAVTNTKFINPGGGWAGDGNSNRLGIEPNITVAQENGTLFLSAADKQFQRALSEARRMAGGGALIESPAPAPDSVPAPSERVPLTPRFREFAPTVPFFQRFQEFDQLRRGGQQIPQYRQFQTQPAIPADSYRPPAVPYITPPPRDYIPPPRDDVPQQPVVRKPYGNF